MATIRTGAAVGAAAILLLSLAALMMLRAGDTTGDSTSGAPSATARTPIADPQRAAPAESARSQAPPPPIRPSAPWLASSGNPIVVRTTFEEGPQRRISPAGGELSLSVRGARVTLEVPPGALERTIEVSMSVATVDGLPFATGPIAVVSIQPVDVQLRRPVRLTAQRTGRSPRPDGDAVGFGVDGKGELHLALAEPALNAAGGRLEATTVMMPRLGVYGVAMATAAEIDSVSTRDPSDYLVRLEHRVARAYPRPEVPRAARRNFTLIPLVHAQEGEPAWVTELVRYLTDTYDQVVVPKFQRIRTPKNRSGIEAEVADATITYNQWMALVELLLPVELDRDLYKYSGYRESYSSLVEQRRQLLRIRGYSDQQIDELTKAFEKYRDGELTRRGEEGRKLVIDAQRKAFDELYRCCMFDKPLEHYPSAMVGFARSLALSSPEYEDFGLDKIRQCNCRAQSAKPGAPRGFEGTIAFTESFDADNTVAAGNRTDDHSLTFTYTNELEILYPHTERQLVADYKLSGSLQRSFQRREQSTCEGRIDLEERYSHGRDSGRDLVNLFVRDTGEYTLSFDNFLLELSGSTRERREWVGANCGPFVKGKVQEKRSASYSGVTGFPHKVTVTGRVDPSKPLEFRGEHTFEGEYQGSPGGLSIPAGTEGPPRRSTVKWNLVACRG